jgi:polyhydroxyalkanoate synthesis regulator phasin
MAKDADQDETGKSRADQLRNAVEGAFNATASGAAPVQKRAQDLADELVGVAARVRETLGAATGGADVADELAALRAQVDALEARVADLENRRAGGTDIP